MQGSVNVEISNKLGEDRMQKDTRTINPQTVENKRDTKGRFLPGVPNPDRSRLNCPNKETEFKKVVFQSFYKNRGEAEKILNTMYHNKRDFKWIAQLLASMLPKEQNGKSSPNIAIYIVRPDSSTDPSPRVHFDRA